MADITLSVAEKVSVRVVGVTASGAEREPMAPIAWSLSDPAFAHVDDATMAATFLDADAVGSGVLSVTAEGLSAQKTYEVTAVAPEPLTSLRIDFGKPEPK